MRDDNWKEIIEGNLNFKNPDIRTYIEAENAYKDEVMKDHKTLEKQIYNELLSRIKEDKESYPNRKDNFYYFQREKEGLNYPILCRFIHTDKLDFVDHTYDFAEEKKSAEVFFDINKEAEGHDLYSFRENDSNKSNSLFAYMYNLTGSLEGVLKVRNLENKKDFDWQIGNTNGDFIWISNSELYYSERDEYSRGKKVYKLDVNQGPSSKKLVFEKPEEYANMFLGLGQTTDEKYIILTLSSGSTQVTYVSEKGSYSFERFSVGTNDITHSIEHYDGSFYILTNEDHAEDFKVMKTSTDYPSWPIENWTTYLHEKKDVV